MFTNFIIGGALETIDTFEDTLSMALLGLEKAPGILECAHTFLSPYKGTDVKKNPEKYGLIILENEFAAASSDSYIFAHSKHLQKNQVLEMGRIFEESIHEKMISLVPDIPKDSIVKQHNAYLFGLKSIWYTILKNDPILSKWFIFRGNNYFSNAHFSYPEIYQYIPTRCFSLEKIINMEFSWHFRNRKFFFNTYEFFLIEMASGKLTLFEIYQRANSIFNFRSTSQDKVINDMIVFYNQLADEFLLLYRRFA